MENNQTDSFVIYRLPFEEKTHLIKGKCETSLKSLASLKGNNFVISPFNHGQKVIYIPFREEEDFNENELLPFNYIKLQNPTENREKKYNEIINLAKDQMKNGNLTKVVLANIKELKTKSFDPIKFFKEIEATYKNAFVYMLSSPETGMWFGASPEPLITTHNNEHKTIALAGTITKDTQQTFGVKELHEQHLVEVFIESKLKETGLKYTKNGPYQHESGRLVHLKTDYTFATQSSNDTIFSLIEELNPTPATAGIPRQNAIDFINKSEGFDRLLYSGFLGLINGQKINLFVNLRCMQYSNEAITLYAGAGITSESIPSNEWMETQNKMKTLENIV